MFGKSLTASWPAGAQIAAASVVAIGGLSLTTSGVWAALQATADNSANPVAVSTGSLSLTLDKQGSTAGVGTSAGLNPTVSAAAAAAIGPLAPGDTAIRYVQLYNGGSLDATGLSLAVTGSTLLSKNATKGLQITVDNCTVAWTLPNATSDGTCTGGSSTAVLSTRALSTLNANASPAGTAASFSGSLYTTIAPSTSTPFTYLKIKLALPGSTANDEVTTNGTLPVTTIQGITGEALTFTFTTAQKSSGTISST